MTYNKYNLNSRNGKPLTEENSEDNEDEDESYWNSSSFSRQSRPKSGTESINNSGGSGNCSAQNGGESLEESRNRLLGISPSARNGARNQTTGPYEGTSSYSGNGNSFNSTGQARSYEQIQAQVLASQQRSVASSERTIQLMQQSEDIGIDTANELARQGEQLDRAERGLDQINRELNTSKRYITSMKSWFAPVKNYFSSNSDETTSTSQFNRAPTSSDRLSNFNQSNHSNGSQSNTANSSVSSGQKDFSIVSDSQMANWSDVMRDNEQRCNQNLNQISGGLERLKFLASGMGDELDRQNEQIDRMNYKTEGNNIKFNKQNNDLKSLLK